MAEDLSETIESNNSCFSDDESSSSWIAIQIRSVIYDIDSLTKLYDDCFRSLQTAVVDLKTLRAENRRLSDDYLDLSFFIYELEASAEEDPFPAAGTSQGCSIATARSVLPKSISVRSSGYLSLRNTTTGGGGESSHMHRLLLPGTPLRDMEERNVESEKEVEEEEEEEAVLVEVFNQGMEKTEMCNKWETLGWCPYGPRCRFAHGMEELRPVVRHPRYKTQICRMLATGCPYGHRCHFRHSFPPSST